MFLQLIIVNKKLTRSAAWREDFNRRRTTANVKRKEDGEPPILALLAEYGVRWNIDLDRWERMYAARDVSRLEVLFMMISLTFKLM